MSGFKALNIESDDESDVEVDDTKELQIEDALKLYHNALKYHADGPASFENAAQAYEELFKSDIFKYPESQTELRRIEIYGPLVETDDLWPEGLGAGAAIVTSGFDTGPSTLPQILHLSHKNYAQFKLEYLTARLETINVTFNQVLSDATAALDHFVDALDKDDTDLDLWRRTASVGDVLESKRVARFCLEAVLDGDDEGLSAALSLPGLDEGLASEQLRQMVRELEDQLSLLQSPLSTAKRHMLSRKLKQRLDSYKEITDRKKALRVQQSPYDSLQPEKVVLKAPNTWAEMGETLLSQLMAEQQGTNPKHPGMAIYFDLPSAERAARRASQAPLSLVDTTQEIVLDEESSIGEQLPGLDSGQVTVQPRIVSADPNMQIVAEEVDDADVTMNESSTVALPTRKRSGDVAGLNEGQEESRTKSKRTRTRESTTAEDNKQAIMDANARWEYEQQINELQAADDWTFETVSNLFERIGIVGLEAGRNVRQELQSPTPDDRSTTHGNRDNEHNLKIAQAGLQAFLTNYSDQHAHILLVGGESFDVSQGAHTHGLAGSSFNNPSSKVVSKPALLPNDGLFDFLEEINGGWVLTQEVAWRWICNLLRPFRLKELNSYRQYLWPVDLKTMVVRSLVNFHESIYDTANRELDRVKKKSDATWTDEGLAELIETIFELHLDIYCLIKQPNSVVDAETISAQGDRLQQWSDLAQEVMRFRSVTSQQSEFKDELSLRFLWATTFNIGAGSDVSQEHVLECMNDLRAIWAAADEPAIQLQNNAIMPELSVATIEREVSRLTTKDFFVKITTQDGSDPVSLIESLEPLLEALDEDSPTPPQSDGMGDGPAPMAVSLELIRFLRNSDMSVRLLLWQRLRDAYLAIDYKPMVVLCYFKMIRLLLTELKSNNSLETPQADRQVLLLKSFRLIQDMTMKALTIIQGSDDAFECIDENGLKAAVSGFGEVLQLLQVFNIHDDSIRMGQTQPPSLPSGLPVASFATVNNLMHDMQVHIWIILYMLLKEAIFQFHDLFPTPAEDMFDFLRVVHRNLGLRGICGSSNRVFVRLLKDEFFQMVHVEGYDSEQAQVLYDLYGLNCFLDPNYELIEHRCTHDAFIDRSVALQAVDLLMLQASKLPMKDLVKHPIKDTIDKVHGAALRKKPTEAIMRNREVHRAFLRSAINPLDLYSCLKGEGSQLTVSPIPKNDAILASKGWYFLMGHIALTKFRSQKRTGPTPTEEVDIAIAFFMQDLEYSMDNWETWFRLAQAYDTKVEESVVWSAEKLNNSMHEIVQFQRAAVHCYTMATALAYRSAEVGIETSEKMTELFTDFATRLYASSREPFRMMPFVVDDSEKFFSLAQGGIGKGKPFHPLREYTAWKLTRVLLKRALEGKPHSWTLHYMLGTVLWKMHSRFDFDKRPHDEPPTTKQVLDSVIRAIELIPDKKDSREKREPVLKPHYKLVSIVHKLVSRGQLTLEQAKEALSHTSYGRTATFPEQIDEWVPHVLTVLKSLRAADKSNWHHRMIARAAQIIYDDSDDRSEANGPSQNLGAMGAKHELTQQMFTKTMVLQVWRPECERAGRHFVYTACYTRFFVRILEQLKDRSNLEMLAKRVRRRPQEFFEHGLVWQDICSAYLRLLRSYASLPEGLETSTFSTIAHEDFVMRKEPLEKWMQAQEPFTFPALDVLRDVQELKRTNGSLMKPGPIDDLIGDSYAYLFNTIGKQIWDEERRVKQEEEARRPPPVVSPPRNPMMSLTYFMNLDGTNEPPTNATQPAQLAQPVQSAQRTATPDPAPARRKIGVGRREIRTCAEACFQKTNVVGSPTMSRPVGRVEIVIDASRTHAGDTSAETSAPGSVHDSADNESELSELEEEGEDDDEEPTIKVEPRPVFPGLTAVNRLKSRDTSDGFETAEEEPAAENADVEMDDLHAENEQVDPGKQKGSSPDGKRETE